MELPTNIMPAKEVNPKLLILFGKPKAGKTQALAGLPNNLVIDLEGGTDYFEMLKVRVHNLSELGEIAQELAKTPNRYNYVSIDTGTALEDMIMPKAIKLYQATPMGKNYEGDDLRMLPNGAGYLYIREAYKWVINQFRNITRYVILTGHLKDKFIDKKGEEWMAMELDLTGRLKSIISAEADAIGYVYRTGENGCQTRVSFITNESIICGARSAHLKNRDILLAESDPTDPNSEIKYHWDKIYLNS